MVIEKIGTQKTNWQCSPIDDEGQSSPERWKKPTPRLYGKISHSVDELGLLVKEKKGTWIKRCRESSRRETEVFATSEDMAEAAKIDNGTRTRIKKGLKQIRKSREEEKTA